MFDDNQVKGLKEASKFVPKWLMLTFEVHLNYIKIIKKQNYMLAMVSVDLIFAHG